MKVYNLNDDPMETKDLVASHPEKAALLIRSLDDYLASVNAQAALPNPDCDPDPNEYSGGIRGLKSWEASRKNH